MILRAFFLDSTEFSFFLIVAVVIITGLDLVK